MMLRTHQITIAVMALAVGYASGRLFTVCCGSLLVWLALRLKRVQLALRRLADRLDDSNVSPYRHDWDEMEAMRQLARIVNRTAFAGPVLDRFDQLKAKSECLFAKKANMTAALEYDSRVSLEQNIERSIARLILFSVECQRAPRKQNEPVDGFVFEVVGEEFCSTVERFALTVQRALRVISDHDPKARHCMNSKYIGRPQWHFVFNSCDFFVTTQAPCYGEHHSRWQHGLFPDRCYIILQPEMSFFTHDIGHDSPHTEWTSPKTMRDKIRVKFRNAGREYNIPDTVAYPTSHHMVKPLDDLTGDVVQWWLCSRDEETGEIKCPFLRMQDAKPKSTAEQWHVEFPVFDDEKAVYMDEIATGST